MNSKLDETDVKILNVLQSNADLELKQTARLVNKSISSVHERIRKLQRLGIIKRYVVVLDREMVGRKVMAVVQITLMNHGSEELHRFEAQMNDLKEVHLCLHLAGAFDFILHISVSDTATFHSFLMNKLFCLPNVSGVQSSFVLRECKSYGPFEL